MRSLFISDLHLTSERPDITRAFLRFLEQDAVKAQNLYILGDFFEFWIGDDLMDPFQISIADALAKLASRGTTIAFMPGNRDFLTGSGFCQRARCRLLNDPCPVTLGNKRVLLMHGDSLCTDDTGYMHFRRIVRNPVIQKLFLALPSRWRLGLAQKLRNNSKAAADSKPMAIMDVNPKAVQQVMDEHRVTILIHGHTHRAAIHPLEHQHQRIVLGDWDNLGWYLSYDDTLPDQQQFSLNSFDIEA